MDPKGMELAAFEEHLDRYGADLARWPAADRAQAESLMRQSEAARSAFAAMERVERVLRAGPLPGLTSDAAIAARATAHRQARPVRPAALGILWTGAAAAALLVGVVLGDHTAAQHEETPDRLMAVALDIGGTVDAD